MEDGIGRLLASDERGRWAGNHLRTAFSIGSGYALTAWHCVRDIGGTEARVWLRLRHRGSSPGYVDVPMRCQLHVAPLDVALLIVDDTPRPTREGVLTVQESRDLLDRVALPLGISLEPHDRVRIAGFPQANPAEWCVMLSGEVSQVDTVIDDANVTRLYVQQFGTYSPESPRGMSGGPVLRRFPDRSERVVAILSAFPDGGNGQIALGAEVLCRRIADLVEVFPPVAEALRSAAPEPCAEGYRPGLRGGLTLSPDVQAAYLPRLAAGPLASLVPFSWTLEELSGLRLEVSRHSREISKMVDMLDVLCEGLKAKRVFLALGGGRLELGQLQATYRHQIGAWPDGCSADALLVEAASVGIAERRTSAAKPLGALARFLVGVAALLRISPHDNDVMMGWIDSLGHQLADAQRHYCESLDSPAWLLIDMGDEPRPDASPWPAMVTWMLLSRNDEIAGEPIRCEPSEAGLRQALGEILRVVPPARPLLVDLAVPRALMEEGIEHWPVLDVDGEAESLSTDCHPRLRWSRRRRDARLRNRLLDRLGQASWEADPEQWLRNDPRCACFLGGRDTTVHDSLRMLLRDGCGFVIWFSAGLPGQTMKEVANAARKVPPPARRHMLPDHLPSFLGNHPVIIWDDPEGRGEFRLPPLAIPESP
jgi:hypothetical protein